MRFKTKRRTKAPYICWIKATNRIMMSTTKVYIANELSINVRTITRNMESSDTYDTPEYTIWRDVPIHYGKGRNYTGNRKSEY
jgi:hypothetical protein